MSIRNIVVRSVKSARWRYFAFLLTKAGVSIGEQLQVTGRPIVSMVPGSSIVIGSRSVLISRANETGLGVAKPIVLRTLTSGASIQIGADVGLSGVTICSAMSIEVGDRVMCGADVMIVDTDFHPVDIVNRRYELTPVPDASDGVRVEDDAFIGARTIVLKGVTIGRGSVVGAGSVVTSDIPPYVVAAGNPARVLRSLRTS